jgi:hypothetical protein
MHAVHLRVVGVASFLAAFLASAPGIAKYEGWTGQDCVDMGKNCIALCDKYGVPETKAACMFNCAREAMSCSDKVSGAATTMSPGEVTPRPPKIPRSTILNAPEVQITE